MLQPFRIVLLIALGVAGTAVGEDRKKESDAQKEERKRHEAIRDLSRKLSRRLAMPHPAPDSVFLNQRASVLLERTRKIRDRYQFDRMRRATNALLEATERIESREGEDNDEDDRAKAARTLQRHYFRVQQAEYFAAMSGEPDAIQYVPHCRSLYQQARSAYDARQFDRARRLGDAASLVVGALENLAQAAVRVPDPPRLN